MIITLSFYKRLPGLTGEQFSDHWRNVHGPLLRDTPDSRRYLRRYIQHHIRPNTAFDADPLPFDGFSEVWYDNIEQRKELFSLPVFKEVFIPDEEKFIDRSRTTVSMIDRQATIIGEHLAIGGETIRFF